MSLLKQSRRILIHNGVYSSTQTSPQERNAHHHFARFFVDVKSVSGTGGLTLNVRAYSWDGVTATNGEAMGNPGIILTAPAAVTATGVFIYELALYPQGASGAVQLTVARFLPVYWDVQVTHADGSNYTYSVSVELFS